MVVCDFSWILLLNFAVVDSYTYGTVIAVRNITNNFAPPPSAPLWHFTQNGRGHRTSAFSMSRIIPSSRTLQLFCFHSIIMLAALEWHVCIFVYNLSLYIRGLVTWLTCPILGKNWSNFVTTKAYVNFWMPGAFRHNRKRL